MVIDADFNEPAAIDVLRNLITRDPNDGSGIDPTSGLGTPTTHLEEGGESLTRASDPVRMR